MTAPIASRRPAARFDLERARRFYEKELGVDVEVQVAETVRYRCGSGTGLAIFERPMTPVDRTVAALEVVHIEAEIADLKSRGVAVEGVMTLASGVRRGSLWLACAGRRG